MKQRIIILAASHYRIEQTDKSITEGISISYLTTENLNSVVNEDGSYGCKAAKGSLPFRQMASIITAPAVYEAELKMKVGSDGKPTLTLESVEFVGEVVTTLKPVTDQKVSYK